MSETALNSKSGIRQFIERESVRCRGRDESVRGNGRNLVEERLFGSPMPCANAMPKQGFSIGRITVGSRHFWGS